MKNIKEIDPKKFYRPKEIIKNHWINNTVGKPDYWFLLNLINSGVLKAVNKSPSSISKGTLPYYQVLGADIIEYRKKFETN